MRTVRTVTLDEAGRVIAACVAEAACQDQLVDVAVVDAGGSLVAHLRPDGTCVGGANIAINKVSSTREFGQDDPPVAAR